MVSKAVVAVSTVFVCCLSFECSEPRSDFETTKDLIARAWRGETFFTVSVDDTSFVARDLVQRFEFLSDGTYYLSRASNSSGGRTGTWSLGDNGRQVELSLGGADVEIFPIVVLTRAQLILGDTTSRGYSLFPL